jgi:hypothetical protein
MTSCKNLRQAIQNQNLFILFSGEVNLPNFGSSLNHMSDIDVYIF